MDNRGGRGGGRGGTVNHSRGASGTPSTMRGLTPIIGVYLDVAVGATPTGNQTYNWVKRVGEYIATITESRIDTIFGTDGDIGEYPDYEEPEVPTAETSKFELRISMKIWEADYAHYRKQITTLEKEIRKTYAIMWGQISDSSKNRIKECEIGLSAIEHQDPRELLQAIYATHMADNRKGAMENLFAIEELYLGIRMNPSETVNSYYQKSKSMASALQEAHRRAGDEYSMPGDKQRGVKFILGLSDEFKDLKKYFQDEIKEWPESLEEAFLKASKFTPEKHTTPQRQNIFVGMKNKNSHKSHYNTKNENKKNEKNEKVPYGSKPVTCYKCGQKGHYSNECRSDGDRDNIRKAVEEQASKQVK